MDNKVWIQKIYVLLLGISHACDYECRRENANYELIASQVRVSF